MSLVLHPKTAASFARLSAKPSSSVIFHGSRGLGKATAALELAAQLNCLDGKTGTCTNCQLIASGNFPDLIWVRRTDKASLSIDQIRALTTTLALRPYRAGAMRIVIVDEAHLLTIDAQNAVLKLLEEPPPSTLIILITEQLNALLVTVRSRCQMIHFVRPTTKAIAELLVGSYGLPGPAAETLAVASGGVPGTAVTLALQPDTSEVFVALGADADLPGNKSVFERLILAGRLVAAGTDLELYGAALQHRIINAVKASEVDPLAASSWLDALELYRTHLRAKVAPRVALERLMLELG